MVAPKSLGKLKKAFNTERYDNSQNYAIEMEYPLLRSEIC